MNILSKYKSFEFDRNKTHIFGIKSGIVWGYCKDINGCVPLLYISKPKHVSKEDFEYMLDHLELYFVKDKSENTDNKSDKK